MVPEQEELIVCGELISIMAPQCLHRGLLHLLTVYRKRNHLCTCSLEKFHLVPSMTKQFSSLLVSRSLYILKNYFRTPKSFLHIDGSCVGN